MPMRHDGIQKMPKAGHETQGRLTAQWRGANHCRRVLRAGAAGMWVSMPVSCEQLSGLESGPVDSANGERVS
jgi:hypothetical protein